LPFIPRSKLRRSELHIFWLFSYQEAGTQLICASTIFGRLLFIVGFLQNADNCSLTVKRAVASAQFHFVSHMLSLS
jgi:hypothetical protein